jgi:hypothetical protein
MVLGGWRCVVCALLLAGPACAAETVTYTYDALGRLTATTSSGIVNNGLSTSIAYDPAGNRTSYGVTGAGGGGPPPPPGNQPPVAVNDSSSGVCNVTKIVNVVANDYDPDGNTPLALVSVTPGVTTDASVSTSTSLAVTGYFRGTEPIFYVVRDSLGATATGRLTYTTTGTDQQCFQ